MSGAEYSAYLHANIEQPGGESMQFVVKYDGHYCGWFASHPSHWTVHLSDETRRSIGGSLPERRTIEIPPGIGKHILWSEKPQC
jgi:hypothetical protein